MIGYFKYILYLFSRKKDSRVFPETYLHVDTKHIIACYNKLKLVVKEYSSFVEQTIPMPDNIEGVYILSSYKYDKRYYYINHFEALYDSILNELSYRGISKALIKYVTFKINVHKRIFDEIDALFTTSIKMLNNNNKLVVCDSAVYTASFVNLFKETELPPFLVQENSVESK
jgi:hypothetical protein